jgi:hypothetical protein
MQRFKYYVYYFLLLIVSAQVWANPIAPEQIPPVLQPWEAWVLYDKPQQQCPFLYNQNETRYCAWPTTISVDVKPNTIYFTQNWQVFAPSMIPLPGDLNFWPQQIQVNGEYSPITLHDQKPMMELPKGIYKIQGYLPYGDTLPEFINIPKQTGLVELIQNTQYVMHPRLDESGQLWLQHTEHQASEASLQLRVFRKVTQAVPMEVLTLIELDVSGPAREVQLGPVLLPGTLAMRLDSSLPAQLDDKGLLRVQLRPGKWQIEINERFPDVVNTLKRAEVGPPWPAEEIWSFVFDSRLGPMSVSGVPSVDPTQTLLPEAWRAFPTYRVLVADPVVLNQSERSENIENQLTLVRHMWLDFSGELWTIEDTLQGQMLSTWRLSLKNPYLLGQFNLNGTPQLITVLENANDEKTPGVEVRQGQLNAHAVSMAENKWRMNVSGWNENFNQINTTVSLPPGWQLLTAFGVDQIDGSVLSHWSLFDIFIVLLLALAIISIVGKKWGLIALFILLMTYHQIGIGLLLWLNVVLALWIMQWLKTSRFARIAKAYRDLSFVILAVMIVWMSSLSLIESLYPQVKAQQIVAPEDAKMLMEARPRMSASDMSATPIDAKTQTGPAKPQWEWTQIHMNWLSKVTQDQNIYLILLSPLILCVLTLLQIIFSIALGLHLWTIKDVKLQMNKHIIPIVALMFLSINSNPLEANEIPDPLLLDTLKERLLEPDSCLPQCASIGAAFVNMPHDEIYLSLQIDALAPVAVPIPGRSAYWQADQVFVNQIPASGLSWQNDTLMVYLDKGHHTIMVYGRANNMDKVSLDFPLTPHRVEVTAPGWFVEGLDNQRLTGNTLDLLRRERDEQASGTSSFAPFVHVIRELTLGLSGEVTTTVERISPVAGPIQLSIPLLAHEALMTPGMIVQNNQVQVNFAPHQREVTWQSTITDYNDLTLFAPATENWVEEWRVKISPIWHPTITGIPVLAQTQYDSWELQWQPWPTQSVHIQLNRLPAMMGSTLTIEEINLLTRVQDRGSDVSMQALLRSTLGGQHALVLPSDANIRSVKVNGVEQVLQTENNKIILAVGPGNNWVDMNWQSPQSLGIFTRTPMLDWGSPTYNINLGIDLPQNRWVIALGGAAYGPALLYWIWVLAAIILAIVLGRMNRTPLKTWQWLVLLLGLSVLTPFLGLWVVVALIICKFYHRHRLMQILSGVLGLTAVVILVYAMIHGLRDMPDMHLLPSALNTRMQADYLWFQDISMQNWPRAWIISLPLWVYRGLMLLWSLWVVMTAIQLLVKTNIFSKTK